jgi:C1A family cysteine protease
MRKSFALGLTLLSLSSFASIDVSKVQTEIRKQNANWISKSTSVSGLSDVEIKRMLGSNEMPDGNGLFFDRTKSTASLDWRNVNGVNWLGPVMNQGNCGSCVAFASVASLEARYRITMGPLWANPTFSPQQLFNCGGGYCNIGWTPGSAASFLKKTGIVDSACVPYVSGSTGDDVSCKAMKCNNQALRTLKIVGSSTPSFTGGSAERVKQALMQGPLLTTMTVYSDFMTYAGGIYKHVTGGREGGHAISLVGYNDLDRYWIIRNSWGDNWGENGFARVSYDDVSGIASSTWAFEITPDKSYFTILSPNDHAYVSGTHDVKVEMLNPSNATIHVSGSTDQTVLNECALTEKNICTQSIDTSTLKDGRYEVFAESNGKRSQVKELFVVNHTPETTLSFSRTDGKPFSTEFAGRI